MIDGASRGDVPDREGQQFVEGVAEQAAGGGVRIDEARMVIGEEDGCARVFEERAIEIQPAGATIVRSGQLRRLPQEAYRTAGLTADAACRLAASHRLC